MPSYALLFAALSHENSVSTSNYLRLGLLENREFKMIRLLILFVVILVVWILFRMLIRKPTLEEARTIGLQEASHHINNPILLTDYIKARGIPKEAMDSLIEEGEIPSYYWRQYIYIENRELIKTSK